MGEVKKFFLCIFGVVALWGIVYYLMNRATLDHDMSVAGSATLTFLKWVGIAFLCAIALLISAAIRYLCWSWGQHKRREEAKTKKLEEEARQAQETANALQGEARQKNALGEREYGLTPYLLHTQATLTVREEGFTPYLIEREALANERLRLEHEGLKLGLRKQELELPYFVQQEHAWVYNLQTIANPYARYPQPQVTQAQNGIPLQLPQAPVFAQVRHLITPSVIPLVWSVRGPEMGVLRDLLSMGLIGRPERGKTTALLWFVCVMLLYGAEVWVWDLHGSMSVLRGLNYFDSFSSIIDSIDYLEDDLEERDELYHQTPRRFKKPRVLVVDELPALAGRYMTLDRKTRNATKSPLVTAQRYTLEARKWQGYTFLAGQGLPHSVITTLTRDSLSSRIVFECTADQAQMMKLPKAAIDTLLPLLKGAERGTHIADFSTWSDPLLADIPYTTEDDLAWVLAQVNGQMEMSRNEPETRSRVVSGHLLPISTSTSFPAQQEREVEMPVNARETNFQAVSSPFIDTSKVAAETRTRITNLIKLRVDGELLTWSKIAKDVGMLGGKYRLFCAVCKELGYDTSKPRE